MGLVWLGMACAETPAGLGPAAGDDAGVRDTVGVDASPPDAVPVDARPEDVATRDVSPVDAGPEPCGPDERVEANACVACPPGSTNAGGDDPSGPDTACDPILCAVDERVADHTCVPCEPGTENEAGDDASDVDTQCEAIVCALNERVASNRCIPCEGELRNEAGDLASGPDTTCFDACDAAFGLSCADFDEGYIKAFNPDESDEFGEHVALSGDVLAVAAPREDGPSRGVDGPDPGNGRDWSGAAYVFRWFGNFWAQVAYLKASNADVEDYYGQSIAADGDRVVVGAILEDSDATGIGGSQTSSAAPGSGAAYVYDRGVMGWTQTAFVKASNTDAGDYFGWAVALSGDTMAVSALGEDGDDPGANGDEASNDARGSGAVYVFVQEAGTWRQQAYLEASNPDPNDRFGRSLALWGDTLVVGADGEDGDAPGVDGDDSRNGADTSGAAYVFERSGETWAQSAYLKADQPRPDEFFGWSVAVHDDTVVVGAPLDGATGAAHVFVRRAGAWQPEAVLLPPFLGRSQQVGDAVAVFDDRIAVGAPYDDSGATGVGGDPTDRNASLSGAVHLFERAGGTWRRLAYVKASNTGRLDVFGRSVAMTATRLAVGAPREASADGRVGGDQTDDSMPGAGAVYVRRLGP